MSTSRAARGRHLAEYQRLRRDIELLCSCRFHCKNAFWDREHQAYVDMNWQLFNSVFYFKATPEGLQSEMPFGFIEVSSVLQQIARTRGFFTLGFPAPFFFKLKPLEQRLSIYLAKKFMSQSLHQRFVDDLSKALPIDAKRPDNIRAILRNAAAGLIDNAAASGAHFVEVGVARAEQDRAGVDHERDVGAEIERAGEERIVCAAGLEDDGLARSDAPAGERTHVGLPG